MNFGRTVQYRNVLSPIVLLGKLIRIQLFKYSHQDFVTTFPNLSRYLHKHDAGHENTKVK